MTQAKIYYAYRNGQYITKGTSRELSVALGVSESSIRNSEKNHKPCVIGLLFESDESKKETEEKSLMSKDASLADAVKYAREHGMTYAQMQVKETCAMIPRIECPKEFTSMRDREREAKKYGTR